MFSFIDTINTFLYTYWLVFALMLCGIYLTLRTRCIQLRFLKDVFSILQERSRKEHISPFGALMISTASRVGIGNIIGVSIAIATGGVGALFWMWLTAIIGGASAFVESTLAQVYKRKDGEHGYKGGPAYYIETALGSKALSIVFALSIILCFAYGFNGLQAYTLTSSFEIFVGSESFQNGHFTLYVGILLSLLVAPFFFGGGKSSAALSSILVPIMALGYLIVALVVVVLNIEKLPMIFSNVLQEAFDFAAIFGGFASSAIVIGIKRGLFS
ncbi:MAG: alanine:cation symporter family protein, partial [Helicobacter sp.]|nr:alanine:cation symporter family protein [Helicobacter sp.]